MGSEDLRMGTSDSFRRRLAPAMVRYLGAVASVAAVLAITWLLGSYSEQSLTPLFFCAIVLTAWYAGLGPGLLSSLLASAALEYFFIPPLYSLNLGVDKLPQVITFALPALFVSWFSSQQKHTEELLRHARDELERQVEQRTADLRRTNEKLQSEVAERKRAEEKLGRSEAYLAESQRQSHTGSYAWNVVTEDSFWSQETYRIFGLDPATTVSHRDWVRQLRHPEDRASIAPVVEAAIREKRDLETDFRIVRPDGSIRHVHTLGHPVVNGFSSA